MYNPSRAPRGFPTHASSCSRTSLIACERTSILSCAWVPWVTSCVTASACSPRSSTAAPLTGLMSGHRRLSSVSVQSSWQVGHKHPWGKTLQSLINSNRWRPGHIERYYTAACGFLRVHPHHRFQCQYEDIWGAPQTLLHHSCNLPGPYQSMYPVFSNWFSKYFLI